jgi:putative ABC transport system substrate-binding protein
MRRREFITLASSAAIAWPLVARAQQPAMPVIGFLSSTSEEAFILAAFRRGLSEQGYVEGRNVTVEYRYAEGRYEVLPALATELVSRQVNVIVAIPSSPAALAAKAATAKIPIVFFLGADPIEVGLVASYNRPGGNATGVTVAATKSLTPKRFELLDELLMKHEPLALLVNPTNRLMIGEEVKIAQPAARALGRDLILVEAGTEPEINAAFETLVRQKARGLAVWQEAYFVSRRHQIASLAKHHRLLTIGSGRAFVEAGVLMSYGSNPSELHRHVGVYVGKILRGASPADLPVLEPTTYELVINITTAKALGLIMPAALLARADEVIE